MMLTAAVGDVRGHLEALRDLGALDVDADLEALARVLHFGEGAPAPDPLKMSSEDLVAEVQGVLRTLLAQGARLPKHLMLYVKGMLFFDGAIAHYRPSLPEIALGAGGLALALLVVMLAVKVLRFVPGPRPEPFEPLARASAR